MGGDINEMSFFNKMSTTQKSEAMNSFFKKKVNEKMKLLFACNTCVIE